MSSSPATQESKDQLIPPEDLEFAIHMMREDDKNNENIKNKCRKVASDFDECMEANQDHYALTEKECWYCLYMKQGECKETYINWRKCVDEAKKNDEDSATKCGVATSALKKCIEADQDYCSREKTCCKETRNFEVTTMSSSHETLKSLFSNYQSKTTEEYLKGGECKEAVTKLENCIDEAKKNNEYRKNKCSEVSRDIIKCMKANQDYYGVSLQELKYASKHNASREEIEKKRLDTAFRACFKDVECKKRYTNWKNCAEGAKKNGEKVAEKCYEVTVALTNSLKPNMKLV
ncbi:GCK domain protein [Artemisia annua]|uniref:GCK domain protein n=1 Tax=Artemisia annua TaxID=35608 RepID=A0A2U1M4S9_ARTAN|nr:GCK domain protein [Artemisia annua]